MSPYEKIRQEQYNHEEFRKITAARMEQIRTHLASSPRSSKLKDKVCIITGVGSLKGIGYASAIRFAHEGPKHLYLIDWDGSNLPDLKSTIDKLYPDVKVTTIQADAADEIAIQGVCNRAVDEEGRLDVFFANAGVTVSIEPLASTTTDTFMKAMQINALSCFYAVKHASAAMKKFNPLRGKEYSSGSIIMTASLAGLRAGGGTVHYSASKAAINSIAQTSAYQLQRSEIRVNTICPGLIKTAMTELAFDYARHRGTTQKLGERNPLGRFGLPEEIAQVAVFLASDDSSYINAQTIAVDGGLSSSIPVAPGRWF